MWGWVMHEELEPQADEDDEFDDLDDETFDDFAEELDDVDPDADPEMRGDPTPNTREAFEEDEEDEDDLLFAE